MKTDDLIMNGNHSPTQAEISSYIGGIAGELWLELTDYLEDKFRVKPKSAYSTCSGKPGWNIKYQKSDKALCTLYPENSKFIVLVVVTLPFIENLNNTGYSDPFVWEIIEEAKPFNKTKWLMIPVEGRAEFESILELLHLKAHFNPTKK